MNRHEALQSFLAGFGVPAYAATSAPAQASYPYLTYSADDGDILSGEMNVTVHLWYLTDSEAEPNAKADEMARAIGLGGRIVGFDGGALWIKRGSPWCQPVPEEGKVKHRYINIDVEYLTTY